MADVTKGTTGGIVLEGPLAELREREIRLLYDVAEYIAQLGGEAGAADRQRLLDSAQDLHEMFLMVVIIGEFNAGKSTFVNALLGDAVLPMGITPTTDSIELVRYGTTKKQKSDSRDGAIREWEHPNTGAPGVVIVDTPGTGSVFQKHEQIARNFLHRSDLVIFLLSAKRAFADTERLYLELAKNYGKKIIVVINQIDLLDSKEQNEVRSFVQKQIEETLDIKPPIFMVSAKKALQGEKSGGLLAAFSGNRNDNGIDEVKTYLRQTFEQVPPAQQKLLAQLELPRSLLAHYRQPIQSKLALTSSDTGAAEDLQHEMEQQAVTLDKQLDTTLKEVHKVLETMRDRGLQFIDRNFGMMRAIRRLNDEKMWAEFEREVIGGSFDQIRHVSDQYANALVDNSRVYWRSVIERLNRMEALLRAEAPNMDAATYADQREALQAALGLADMQMNENSNKQIVDTVHANFSSNLRGFGYSALGGGLGLAAFIAAHLTPGAVTLYPLAALGAALGPLAIAAGGAGAAWYWIKTIREAKEKFNTQVTTLEDGYRQALTSLTSKERARLLQYGKQILAPVFSQLQALANRYKDQVAKLDSFADRAKGLETEIASIKAHASIHRV